MIAVLVKKRENGFKTFCYKKDGISFEIDEVQDGFVMAECNVSYYLNVMNTHAKTKETLINRLFRGIWYLAYKIGYFFYNISPSP